MHDGLSPREGCRRSRCVRGTGGPVRSLTVAISVSGLAFFGLDFVTKLGVSSGALGVLTTVLIANSLLIAVLAKLGHKVDRLKVPFLRQIDDSERAREDARGPLGPFRDRPSPRRLRSRAGRGPGSRVDLGARSARRSGPGTQPKKQTSQKAYDLLAEGFRAGFNGPIPIVVDVNDDPQAPQRIYNRVGAYRASPRWRSPS